jgi:hypothetical protein
VAHQREGDLDEVVAGPGPIQERAEQHEEEDHVGRHAERDAENALRRDPLVVGDRLEAGPLPGQDSRRVGTEERVAEEDDRDDHQGRAERPARRFQQQHRADAGDDDVLQDQVVRAVRELFVEGEEIERRGGRDDRQNPILDRNAIARTALQRRIEQVAEEDGEGEMDRPRLGGVKDADANLVGDGRGVPELESRPAEGDDGQEEADALIVGRASAGVDGGYQVVQIIRFARLGGALFAHRFFPHRPRTGRPVRLGVQACPTLGTIPCSSP